MADTVLSTVVVTTVLVSRQKALSCTYYYKKKSVCVCVCVCVALVVKNLPANAGEVRVAGSIPRSGKIPWRRA